MVDANNFTINFNSSGIGTTSSASGFANLYCTLNIGGRGAFPIIFDDGEAASTFGNNYMNEGGYKTFRFDKTVAGQTDGSGNYVLGAWIFSSSSTGGLCNDVPIEVCTACVNELNALSVVQGGSKPIHMYLCTTPFGIDGTDPDQTSSKLYGANAVNVVLNGANGYPGLTSVAHLFIENTNETFNFADVGLYYAFRARCRWPTAGGADVADITMLRATAMAIDISNSFPSQVGNGVGQRVHRVLGGAPNNGAAIGSTYYQYWFTGANTTLYSTDSLVTSGSWGAPGTHHEAYNRAPYCQPLDSYFNTTTGTGTFTDDSAMYNGTNNSANGGGNYSGAANQTQAIANFVAQVSIAGGIGTASDTTLFSHFTFYTSVISGWMPAGKFYMEYEGGPNWVTQAGQKQTGSYTLTANDQTFMLAIYDSSAWGVAQVAYFNAMAALPNVGMPAVYIISTGSTDGDQRFAYASPDSYASGIEGQALLNSGPWAAMSARNAALN